MLQALIAGAGVLKGLLSDDDEDKDKVKKKAPVTGPKDVAEVDTSEDAAELKRAKTESALVGQSQSNVNALKSKRKGALQGLQASGNGTLGSGSNAVDMILNKQYKK